MAIRSLAYLGIRSDRTEDWRNFAGTLLGMQPVEHSSRSLSFRMDDLKQRLLVSDEPGKPLAFIGWEVEELDDLETYAARLEDADVTTELGSTALADERCVSALIVCHDPAGNRIELAWKPEIASEPFQPGRPVSGFVTGPVGMGHVVLNVEDTETLVPFYRDVLGFALSDFGLEPVPLYFFHVNGRHHSFAIVGAGTAGFHHFMIEYRNLDDVGQGYDLALLENDLVAYTLGRHTNDYMTSFYSRSPSGFLVESGWGGRIIDPANWQPEQTTIGPSFWGHERLHLSEKARADFRNMRLDSAARGLRAPGVTDCPWLYDGSLVI